MYKYFYIDACWIRVQKLHKHTFSSLTYIRYINKVEYDQRALFRINSQSDLNRRSITLTSQWPRWRLKSPASRLFTQSFIQAQIKENIKAPRHWPLCGEFTGTGEFPAQKASYMENNFDLISSYHMK